MKDLLRLHGLVVICIFVLFAGVSNAVGAGALLNCPQRIWKSLTDLQRAEFSDRYVVNVIADSDYGVIIDAQTVDESNPGSTAGSRLGAAYGSALYVDNSFRGAPKNWNYSATGNLTAALAGAIIGSMADRPAEVRFHTRYTLRNGNGDIAYVDQTKADAFRHSVGICVSINPLKPIESATCNLTAESFVSIYSLVKAVPLNDIPPAGKVISNTAKAVVPSSAASVAADLLVVCRFGMASPIRLPEAKCLEAGGVVVP